MYPSDCVPPRIYGMGKAYKPEKNYPMCPVVSTINTPPYGTLEYMVKIIEPTLNKNTTRLINSKIEKVDETLDKTFPINMSVEEALALKMNTDLNDKQYQMIKNSALVHNVHIYPKLHDIFEEKLKYYPENMHFSEISAKCTLQSMLDHTVSRITEMIDMPNCGQGNEIFGVLYGKIGFLTAFVPLLLKVEDVEIWKNGNPSSCNFCRPLHLQYKKENFIMRKRIRSKKSNKYLKDVSQNRQTQSKKNYYSSLLNKTFGNARKTLNVIKELTGVGIVKSDNLPKRLQRDDNRGDAFVNKEIAETFNSFFINIGKMLAGGIPEGKKSFKFFLKKSDSFMEESELLIDELRLAISMLKTNKSAGLDKVNPDVVKAVSDIIKKPLFKIFNLSLKNGIFPDQLKLAKIIPIYKGGDDSIKSNYRPISILSCFSKILERIMHNRLYNYLEESNILYDKHFGFRNNHSTEHAVIDLANQILNGFDNDSYTLGIFLDLSKAFDTVNHKILIYKLHNYGVVHSNLKWLQCYLQNRKQGVPYDLTCSPFESINCGVPQGSILGPLLFLIYINDIYLSSKILNYIIFADGTNVFFSDSNLKNIFYIVNTELIYLNEWFEANKLSLNIEKTKYILFETKSTQSCNVCDVKPKEMNNIGLLKAKTENESALGLGGSALHCWIKCLDLFSV
ncbi:uncharacterized protein LOC136090891 [Hydra vulgaris]|uniref:Uncharacterized protein LOC136090891 n=1 Tax=Hydra vulgaris TaxID=6087 RepID=A0ABM4DHH5_HYDVU